MTSKYSENMSPDLKSAIGWMYNYIKPGSTFLDFGCSTGYFGSLIKNAKNARVYGVEISDDVAEAKKVLDGIYSFDLDGDWPDKIYERKYDYAFFGDVLEHLKYPEEALKKTAKLLKDGGKIFVSIPNIAHLRIRLELLGGSFEHEPTGILDNTHLKYFTLESFSNLANEAGYQVEAIDYTVDDYPKEIITKILKQYGLTPEEAFWQLADTAEARTSQYKFVLKPTVTKISQKKLPMKSLPTKLDKHRDSYIEDLRTKAELLHKHANEQAKIIEHLTRAVDSLRAENAQLVDQVKILSEPLAKKIKRKLTNLRRHNG